MNKPVFAVLVLAGLTLRVAAGIVDAPNPFEDDATLQFLLGKSSCAVVATVRSCLASPDGGPIYQPGVIKLAPMDWLTGIAIERVLGGSAPTEKELMIHVYQMTAQNGVTGRGIEEGKSYIFFLKPCEPHTRIGDYRIEWSTSDVWFGFLPFDTALAERLKKLEWERFKKQNDIKDFPGAPIPSK